MESNAITPYVNAANVATGWRSLSREEKHVRLQGFVHQALIEEAARRGLAIEKAIGMLHLYGMQVIADTVHGLYQILDASAGDERVHTALQAWIQGDLPVLYTHMSAAVTDSSDYLRRAAGWSIEPPRDRGFWGKLLGAD